jgi:hypothetical protein
VGSKTDLFMGSILDSCEIIFKKPQKESKIDPLFFSTGQKQQRGF